MSRRSNTPSIRRGFRDHSRGLRDRRLLAEMREQELRALDILESLQQQHGRERSFLPSQ